MQRRGKWLIVVRKQKVNQFNKKLDLRASSIMLASEDRSAAAATRFGRKSAAGGRVNRHEEDAAQAGGPDGSAIA